MRPSLLHLTLSLAWALTAPAAEVPPKPTLLSAPKRAGSAANPDSANTLTNRVPKTTLSSMAMLDNRHKLGFGDILSFRVIEDKDDPLAVTVTDAGELEVPYIGLVKAADKTCKQLAEEIKTMLEKDYYYRATVILALDQLNKKRILGKVYVSGNVRLPGSQEIPADEPFTVSKAIVKAGGFGDFADRKKVRVLRSTGPKLTDKKTLTVNVQDVLEKGKMQNDIVVEPDDLIFVPQRSFNW